MYPTHGRWRTSDPSLGKYRPAFQVPYFIVYTFHIHIDACGVDKPVPVTAEGASSSNNEEQGMAVDEPGEIAANDEAPGLDDSPHGK